MADETAHGKADQDLGTPALSSDELSARKQDFLKRLENLELLSGRMLSARVAVTICTALNLLMLMLAVSFLRTEIPASTYFVLVLTFFSVATIIWFGIARSDAQVIFEELSEEVQWFIGREQSKHTSEPIPFKPDLRTRLVLRTYARATDLLFVPGEFGPGIYLLINIAIALVWFFFLKFSSHSP